MGAIKARVKDFLRPIKNILFVVAGFSYDFFRYFAYAGWRAGGAAKRDYRAVKIYHRLEKSLSFRTRKLGSGAEAIFALSKLFNEKEFDSDKPGFQERVAVKVMNEFLQEMQSDDPRINESRGLCRALKNIEADAGGVVMYTEQELLAGRLEDPERFFMSRYSVRDFQRKAVDRELIRRALQLAMKSPSVCSRQAWHVYHIEKREIIDNALKLQNGNRGFGHEVPCLLILAADLHAFDTASERYQHWIDGGMFSMSMVLALHSLGLGSCCLNWSKGPVDDMKLRKTLSIQGSHSILMMMAVGYANESLKVCCSVRRPDAEVYTLLE